MAEIEYDTKRPIKRLGQFLRSESKMLYLILFYALVYGAIGLVLPLGIQAIINFILAGRVSSSWFILIVIITFGLTLSGIVQIAQLKLVERLQQRIFAKSSFELAVRIPKIKLEAMDNRYAPEFINQFFDTINLQKGMAKLVIDYPTAVLQVFFGLVLISVYHPYFMFFSVIVALILYLMFRFTGPQGIETSLKESTKKYMVAHWLEELGRTMGTFKLAGVTNLPLLKVDRLIVGYLHYRQKHFGVLLTQYKVMIVFKIATTVALLIVGSLLLIDNQISLGQFVAAEIVIILIIGAIEKLIMGLASVYDTLTALEKVGMITDLDMEGYRVEHPRDIKASEGFDLGVEDLYFQYPDADQPTVNKVTFKIPSGQKVALIGMPGSGKSTFLQLLVGLFENYTGRITYNDISLQTLKHDALRSQIGDNIWKETIFEGTLRENLTIGRADISDSMIRDILELVGATDSINRLNKGLDTTLFPMGMKLPRTLSKKIVLARAIIGDPKLLLLETETDFLSQIEKDRIMDYVLSRKCTAIITTRQMEAIQRMDRIIYMERGKVVFDGNYNEFNASPYAEPFR